MGEFIECSVRRRPDWLIGYLISTTCDVYQFWICIEKKGFER